MAIAVTSARQNLANNLKALRLKKNLSQEGLAFEAGLHRTFVAHVERGVRNISIDNIDRIANALGTTASELLKEQNSVV
jgi:transcriptional regulator with XRE-family HTH domain